MLISVERINSNIGGIFFLPSANVVAGHAHLLRYATHSVALLSHQNDGFFFELLAKASFAVSLRGHFPLLYLNILGNIRPF